jgi:ribonuclease HII
MSRKPTAKAERLPLKEDDVRPTFRRERRAINKGIWPIAGCDEAGRGPLAGPVVAAAVVLDPKRIPRGLNDSKKLDREQREQLYLKICASAEVAVAYGSTARIDRDNIRQASLWALARKVTRDRLMCRLGAAHPGYGFERHMGYSVPEHFAALTRLGPTIHHRRSFAPVAACYGEVVEEVDLVTAEANTRLPL